ncbi:MAG: glycosyltransferase family A protein [Pseudomonadota bacterium]
MDSQRPPPITMIMAVRDSARFIAEAVESLRNQSLPPAEIIVVDDGSEDGSGEIARAAGGDIVRVIQQGRQGLGVARKAGLAAAATPIVGFFDSDDVAPADRLDALAQPFVREPGVAITSGHWCNFETTDHGIGDSPSGSGVIGDVHSEVMITSSLYMRDAAMTNPPFEIGNDLHCDGLWVADMLSRGLVHHQVDSIVLRRRIHDRNMSRLKTDADLLDFVFELKRRRQSKA